MKREEYAFAYNLNGTGTPGIVTLTNPPRLICLCSKENSRLILDALNSSLPPAEGAEAIQPHITCPKCGSTNNSELAKNDRLCYDCNHSWSEQQPTADKMVEEEYDIDFGGHLKAGIRVSASRIEIIGAVNGWGNAVPDDDIKVTKIEP